MCKLPVLCVRGVTPFWSFMEFFCRSNKLTRGLCELKIGFELICRFVALAILFIRFGVSTGRNSYRRLDKLSLTCALKTKQIKFSGKGKSRTLSKRTGVKGADFLQDCLRKCSDSFQRLIKKYPNHLFDSNSWPFRRF